MWRAGRRQAGFTLVEILVVLAVAGLLAGLAAGVGGRQLDGWRMRGAGHDLVADLRRLRAAAMAANRPKRLTADPQSGTWRPEDEPERRVPDGARLVVSAPELVFRPDGTAAQGGRIALIRDGAAHVGGVEPLLGRVTLRREAAP